MKNHFEYQTLHYWIVQAVNIIVPKLIPENFAVGELGRFLESDEIGLFPGNLLVGESNVNLFLNTRVS